MSFSSSIALNIVKIKSRVNATCYKITREFFLSIVSLSPSPDNPGEFAKGLLANQWYPQVGAGFSSAKSGAISPNGADSVARIMSMTSGMEFFGKNGRISLANNIHYAFRAEFKGWPANESPPGWRWSGKAQPYRMVARSLQAVAARYK
jgi:hypothetical protein